MIDLIQRFLSSSAKRCPRCGGGISRLTPAGALVCAVCSPGESATVFVATPADGGKLIWRQWSEDFDGQVADAITAVSSETAQPSATTAAGVEGERLAAGAVVASHPPTPYEVRQDVRTDPVDSEPPGRLMAVSVRLAWKFDWRGGEWDRVRKIDGVFWRQLDQPYFAWLVQQVDGIHRRRERAGLSQDLDQRGRPNGFPELYEIAVEAANARIFGEWAMDESEWPRRAPVGFEPFAGVDSGDGNVFLTDFDDPAWVTHEQMERASASVDARKNACGKVAGNPDAIAAKTRKPSSRAKTAGSVGAAGGLIF